MDCLPYALIEGMKKTVLILGLKACVGVQAKDIYLKVIADGDRTTDL